MTRLKCSPWESRPDTRWSPILRPLDAVPETALPHVGPSFGDAFFISGLIHSKHSHRTRLSMSATTTITRTKRPASMRRLAARPRISAVAGDVCVIAGGLGGRGTTRSITAAGGLRDHGGEFGQVGIEARQYAGISTTSFNAEVSLGT